MCIIAKSGLKTWPRIGHCYIQCFINFESVAFPLQQREIPRTRVQVTAYALFDSRANRGEIIPL